MEKDVQKKDRIWGFLVGFILVFVTEMPLTELQKKHH